MSIANTCKIEQCDRSCAKYEYCDLHQRRIDRTGTPYNPTRDSRPAIIDGDIVKLQLGVGAKDGYALVDKEFLYLDKYKWYLSKRGYPVTNIGYEKVRLHNLIINKYDDGLVTDHINRDKTDNRRFNLRRITQVNNNYNSPPKGGLSKYKGVHKKRDRTKWSARIMLNGNVISLGHYLLESDAAKAYDKAAKQYFGEYAYLNFPDNSTH